MESEVQGAGRLADGGEDGRLQAFPITDRLWGGTGLRVEGPVASVECGCSWLRLAAPGM